MKYVVVLGDGMADWKIEELGNKTCLEAAKTPNLDRIAKVSQTGLCKTVPDGFKPGSDVANMSVLGFPPEKYYTGRSPIEAVSMGIDLKCDDLTVRCNLVTLSNEENYAEKTMLDYSAGEITTEEAKELITFLNAELKKNFFEFYAGVSYRHCLVLKGFKKGNTLTPPHDITGRKIGDYLPQGECGKLFKDLMEKSYMLLSTHPVNIRRINEGKKPANSIWLWGEGTKPEFDKFENLHNLKGGIISAVDLVTGLGILAGMEIIKVDGITGNYDTNFKGKAEAAVSALKGGLDFVYIHMEAPDECGHHGDFTHKVYSIEQIDEKVIKTLLKELSNIPFAMLVCPDHPTPCKIMTHVSDPVPYLIYTNTKNLDGCERYTEDNAEKSGIVLKSGTELLKRLLSIK